MTKTYFYTTSESGNITVVKTESCCLLIKVDGAVYMTDDPGNPPATKEVKKIVVPEGATIAQIFEAVEECEIRSLIKK